MRVARRVEAGIVLGALLIALVCPCPALGQEYTIRTGDVLEIFVLGEPQVSGNATVSPDGDLVLAFAGVIPVVGLTLPQVTQKITEALREYVRDPRVTVSIRAAHRQYAYVLGQIARPGAYEIDKGWTISQLVAVAGGPKTEAALARTLVMRKETTIPVDLSQVLVDGNTSSNLALEAGDVVIVPESKDRVVVMGAVQKPGPYLFKPGDRVVDALSAAGGPTQKATMSEIGLIRQEGQKPGVKPLNLDKFYKSGDAAQNLALRPGDIVYVPEHTGVDWSSLLSGLSGLLGTFLLFK